MICKKCGKEIPDGSKFCPECGYDFSEKHQTPEKKKNSPLGIIALIISFFGPAGFIGSIIGIVDIVSDKEKKRTHTLAIIAIVLGIIVTFATSGGIIGNPSESNIAKSTSATTEISNIQNTTETSSATAVIEISVNKDASEKAKKIYEKGQEYTNKNTSITMIDCGIASKDQLSEYSKVPDGCEIVYASFEVNNIGDSSQSVMYTDFNGYADDASCDQFYSLEGLGKTGMDFADTLSAGRKISGTVGFAVPKNAKNFEIEYKPNVWLDDVITFNVPLN